MPAFFRTSLLSICAPIPICYENLLFLHVIAYYIPLLIIIFLLIIPQNLKNAIVDNITMPDREKK